MIKEVGIPDTKVGIGQFTYQIPESLDGAKLITVTAVVNSIAIPVRNIWLAIQGKSGNIKSYHPSINAAAPVQFSNCTWGGTGTCYTVTLAGNDYLCIPMQKIDIDGGDILTFNADVGAGGNWTAVTLWMDTEIGFVG